jgi:hypothetical protein
LPAWVNTHAGRATFADQQRGAVVGRTSVREDWALSAVVACGGWGGDWSGSSWSIPIASVVPVSL